MAERCVRRVVVGRVAGALAMLAAVAAPASAQRDSARVGFAPRDSVQRDSARARYGPGYAPGYAPRDSMRVRVVSAYEAEVEQLALELELRRWMQVDLTRMLAQQRMRLEAIDDETERRKFLALSETMSARLRTSSGE